MSLQSSTEGAPRGAASACQCDIHIYIPSPCFVVVLRGRIFRGQIQTISRRAATLGVHSRGINSSSLTEVRLAYSRLQAQYTIIEKYAGEFAWRIFIARGMPGFIIAGGARGAAAASCSRLPITQTVITRPGNKLKYAVGRASSTFPRGTHDAAN